MQFVKNQTEVGKVIGIGMAQKYKSPSRIHGLYAREIMSSQVSCLLLNNEALRYHPVRGGDSEPIYPARQSA